MPSRTRLVAAASALCVVASGVGAHPSLAASSATVSLRAGFVGFYPGHLVLDGIGDALLDDGFLHVHADRIILDMRNGHYVAAGNVTIEGATQAQGDAVGVDLATHRGVLVNSEAVPSSIGIDGKQIGGAATAASGGEPLALPDVGLEQPYARATRAVAHIGADVRLTNAHIIVPGGESVGLPSYVYTYSSNPGYSATNIYTNSEDLPIYFGSTADSIQGVHLSYNTVSKIAFGLDSHFVGERSYVLVSGSPLIGPTKNFNFTLQDNINDHTTQTFNSFTTTGFGTTNRYDLRDSIHQSTLELGGFAQPGANSAAFAWQGFNQYFGSGQSRPYYNLRSEYGYEHVAQQGSFPPFAIDTVLPNTTWHTALTGYLASPTWFVGQNVNLYGSATLRGESDNLPHRQVSQLYTLTLYTRWTKAVSTYFTDAALPQYDAYPSVTTIFHSRTNTQTLTLNYDNGDPFALSLIGSHASMSTDNPSGASVLPWELSGNVRFRLTRSLSVQLTRSYFFGFSGERFGVLGVQILP